MLRRTKFLRLFNGLKSGRLDFESFVVDFPVQKFTFFRHLPGYIEDAKHNPVSTDEFHSRMQWWPHTKLEMKIDDTPNEALMASIRLKLEKDAEGSFSFLAALIPEDLRKEWQREKEEKENHEVQALEKQRVEQERIAEKWDTLHPLNQEWGIPPPPTDKKTKNDHRITNWVNQYLPYMYECNGYLFRKINQNRHENIYYQSFKDHSFYEERNKEPRRGVLQYARDDAGSAVVVSPVDEKSETESESESDDSENHKDGVKRSIGSRLSPSPVERGAGGEAPPPPKYKYSDLDLSYEKDQKIKRIAKAMHQIWPEKADKRDWEVARKVIEKMNQEKLTW